MAQTHVHCDAYDAMRRVGVPNSVGCAHVELRRCPLSQGGTSDRNGFLPPDACFPRRGLGAVAPLHATFGSWARGEGAVANQVPGHAMRPPWLLVDVWGRGMMCVDLILSAHPPEVHRDNLHGDTARPVAWSPCRAHRANTAIRIIAPRSCVALVNLTMWSRWRLPQHFKPMCLVMLLVCIATALGLGSHFGSISVGAGSPASFLRCLRVPRSCFALHRCLHWAVFTP